MSAICVDETPEVALQSEEKPCLFWVGLYLQDRAYGGREEGGWYYDCGELVTDHSIYAGYCGGLTPSCHLTHEAAQAARDQMAKGLEKLNEGRRDISSVLSEGRYGVEIHEDALPPFYPERRPHYE